VSDGKLTKEEAGYKDVSKYPLRIRSCGVCDHFRDGKCSIVRGQIRAAGGCMYFTPRVLPCGF